MICPHCGCNIDEHAKMTQELPFLEDYIVALQLELNRLKDDMD